MKYRVGQNQYGWYAERINGSYTEYYTHAGTWRSDCTKDLVYFTTRDSLSERMMSSGDWLES